jgi:hypothetical protein
LIDPPKRPEPPLEFDDQPVGAAMMASATYTGVGVRTDQPATSTEAKQISEIERLLD